MSDLPSNVLVVLNGDDTGRDLLTNPLVIRAVDLASRLDGKLLLLRICYDHSLSYGAFAPRDVIDQARLKILEAENTELETMKARLAKITPVEIGTAVRWGYDRSAEILRAARAYAASLIMKARGDQTYVLGLFSTTDWDLLRDSDIPVWFVAADAGLTPESGVIAAIDQVGDDDPSEATFRLDRRVFNHARRLAAVYQAPLHVVHAYDVPRGLGYDDYLPLLAPDAAMRPAGSSPHRAEFDAQARREIAGRHGRAIREFLAEQDMSPDQMIVAEGPVDRVLATAAEEKRAGLIVMGAAQRDRWDRFMGRVNAEPTLDKSPCDMFFVKLAGDA